MTTAELKARIEALERDVAELKSRIQQPHGAARRWWIEDAGRFADDPVFEEMVRLGREYRESLRPRQWKGRTR